MLHKTIYLDLNNLYGTKLVPKRGNIYHSAAKLLHYMLFIDVPGTISCLDFSCHIDRYI